jgi:hypothetical protein
VNASSTIASPETPVMTSMNTTSVEAVMAHLEATTHIGVGVMIARRIAAHPPSRRALESSARPFEGPSFRSSFTPNESRQV